MAIAMRHRQVGKARPWETQPEGLRGKKHPERLRYEQGPRLYQRHQKGGERDKQDVLCPKEPVELIFKGPS